MMTIQEHISLSFQRLQERIYSSEQVWQESTYSWPADWEGRCLLALVCLNQVSDTKNEYADVMVRDLGKHFNHDGYMGRLLNLQEVDEQQLSGHGWLLRGLMAYYSVNQDANSLEYATGIVEHLFLPITDYVASYPIERVDVKGEGGVSGHNNDVIQGWRVSTDIGCAFISLDGLTAYYAEMPNKRVRILIDNMIERFRAIPKLTVKAQTHATLTAARAILRMYDCTGDTRYLQIAQEEFEYYCANGMTDTYENFNWFGRKESWTEPCAVVDSFILALRFWQTFGQDTYRILARRIWFNGLSFCHRQNGGAGPNTCVTKEQPVLKVSMFEAPFCCTMRYCEGLLYAMKNKALLEWSENANVIQENGRRFQDDILLIQNQKTGQILKITDVYIGLDESEEEFLVYYNEEKKEREEAEV